MTMATKEVLHSTPGVKTSKEFAYSSYSHRLTWRFRLDVIACIILFCLFCMIISILNYASSMDFVVSQEITNYHTDGEIILIFSAVMTVLVLLLLALPLCFHSGFSEDENNELRYILGIYMAEEIEEPLPSQPMDKLGLNHEGKWTFNRTSKAKNFGKDNEEKWTYGRIKKLESQV